MNKKEEFHICQAIALIISNASERFEVLEGKDKYALQNELLEWISCDWHTLDVDWFEEFINQ